MKEQNYLDHLVGVFGQPVAENPGVIIQDAAFAAMGLERWHFLTLDVDKDQLENAINEISEELFVLDKAYIKYKSQNYITFS